MVGQWPRGLVHVVLPFYIFVQFIAITQCIYILLAVEPLPVLSQCQERIFGNGCTENFYFTFRRCDWPEQLRENEIFLYSVTTTLSHPELHDKELYIKKTKFVENKI